MKREDLIISKIYEAYEKKNSFYLTRLGASGIGYECSREVWYNWRGFSKGDFPGRILRLFETGYIQEDRVVADLRKAGYEVFEKDGFGKQFTYTYSNGHFVYKSDGVIKVDTPHVLEVKSSNKNGYEKLVKSGVQKIKPEHYAQMQIGCFLMDIPDALYVVVCKDDESYYVEQIKADPEYQSRLCKKIDDIVQATIAPIGISPDGTAWGCKYCDHKGLCAGTAEPVKTCRSCQNATVVSNGDWACGLDGVVLSQEKQLEACSDYNRY